MGYVTPEQITQAKELDLLTYLQRFDPQELVHVSGSTYCTREHDSLKISNGKWNWFSRGIGGKTALDYLIKVQGFSFTQAVEALVGQNFSPLPRAPQAQPKKQEPRVLSLPKSSRCATHMVSYLHGRGIDYDVIDYCIQTGRLYESLPYHNCVFVGREASGKPVFASKRGTYDLNGSGFKGDAVGSDKNVAFRLPCDPALDWVAVFEAPIDLMSFCTLHRQVRSNAVALCGLYQGPLDTYLRENSHLKRIVLCLDADGPGREATEKFQAEYAEKGYTVSARAPAQGKDWNECLQLCGRARERRDQRQDAAR